MPRLFIAVDMPETIKNNLSLMAFGIPGAKWVAPEQLHLTVRFIGEVDGGLFRDIKEILGEIHFASFSLQLKGVGYFPPRERRGFSGSVWRKASRCSCCGKKLIPPFYGSGLSRKAGNSHHI